MPNAEQALPALKAVRRDCDFRSLRMGLLRQFLPPRCPVFLEVFQIIYTYLSVEYSYLSSVTPCQIWTDIIRTFAKSATSLKEKLTNGPVVTPTQIYSLCVSTATSVPGNEARWISFGRDKIKLPFIVQANFEDMKDLALIKACFQGECVNQNPCWLT